MQNTLQRISSFTTILRIALSMRKPKIDQQTFSWSKATRTIAIMEEARCKILCTFFHCHLFRTSYRCRDCYSRGFRTPGTSSHPPRARPLVLFHHRPDQSSSTSWASSPLLYCPSNSTSSHCSCTVRAPAVRVPAGTSVGRSAQSTKRRLQSTYFRNRKIIT